MRLKDLKPQFLKYEERMEDIRQVDGVWDGTKYVVADGRTWEEAGRPIKVVHGPREYLIPVETLAEAQCIMFLCPLCYRNNGGEEGTHHVQMPFAKRGVSFERHKHQWDVVGGTSYDDLSTNPSYLIIGGCGWHGYLTSGEATII